MLRRWQLDSTAPYTLQLAADARLSRTSYTDDQIWELSLGLADTPALSLQTRYGGRVGLASLVPMWVLDGRTIYQFQTYATSPSVTAFAPGYIQLEGKLTPEVAFTADYWAMESQSVGGRYVLENRGSQPVTLQLELFGHVGSQDKELPLAILSLQDGTNALSMGRLRNLEPVVVLEGATAQLSPGRKASPKISNELSIQPDEKISLRWVHSGLPKMINSLERAQFWLNQDWNAAFEQIIEFARALPEIETGDAEQDAAIAFSYMQLMQSFLRPTEHLPYTSFVASRQVNHGYSRRGDGSDYGRGWGGQIPQLAYMTALAVAPIAPDLAQGIARNYLAVQTADGWVDARPGLSGQRQEMLCPPLLARMVLEIYRYTQDFAFLEESFPKLLNFFNRWSEDDLDADGDTLPEWQDERQTGYVFWPTFGGGQPWAQNADIRQIESPDIVAYLLSEALSLKAIAAELGNAAAHELEERIQLLRTHLDTLWYAEEKRYAYQDRDTDQVTEAINLVRDARADEEQILAFKLEIPARLIVRVSGGTSNVPRTKLKIEGLNADGNKISEEATEKDFHWTYGHGVYTSRQVYHQVDRVQLEGLSRVYRLSINTLDLSRLDVNALMPMWSGVVSAEKTEDLVRLAGSEAHFLRSSGLTIVSANDANFDPSSARGGGGTWAYWTTLLGEALLDAGYPELATDLLQRLLKTQVTVLKQQKHFSEFYHSDEPIGLGETGFLTGIVPLHLLMRVLGVRIVNPARLWVGGRFTWGTPVAIRQHGITISRSRQGTQVEFPSGHTVDLPADAEWQEVVDPTPLKPEQAVIPTAPAPPDPAPSGRISIDVERNDPDDE